MYCTKARNSSTTNRYIYRGNRYTESIHGIRPPSKKGNTPNTRPYIRNEGPPKGYYIKAYKLRDPSPTGYREGIRNMGATIIISKKLAPHKESTAKTVKNKSPLKGYCA